MRYWQLEENKLKERKRGVVGFKRDLKIFKSENEYLVLGTDYDIKLKDFLENLTKILPNLKPKSIK